MKLKLLIVTAFLCALPNKSMAALVAVQRGLTTQSEGQQTAASPGDVGTVGAGIFQRVRGGPSLSGWPYGWSAENKRDADSQMYHTWTVGASSVTTSTGCIEAYYFFSHPQSFDIPGRWLYLLEAQSLGGAEFAYLQLNVPSQRLDLVSVNGRFTTQVGISTVPVNTWVGFRLAYAQNGATGMDLKVKMKTCTQGQVSCGAWTTIATVTNYFQNGQRIDAVQGGASRFGDARAAFRYGLPTLYSMTSMADADTNSDVVDPPPGPNNWYVSSCSSGTMDGRTLATAWTGAELTQRVADTEFQVLGGTVTNPITGSVVDVSNLSVDALLALYEAGTAKPMGDAINFDDTCGPVFLASTNTVTPTWSDNIRLQPISGLGHWADVRGTTRLASTDWTPADSVNKVYVSSTSNQYGALLEFDSLSDANQTADGYARILAHPTAANLAAYLAAATPGSFWSDGGAGNGTHVYVYPTGSGDPRSNGKVYELSRQNNMFYLTGNGALVKNLNLRYSMGVGVNNNAGSDNVNCDIIKHGGADGMFVYDSNNFSYGGRHILAVTEATTILHPRYIVLNSFMNIAYPTDYGAVGGQTLSVIDLNTDALDFQAYWKNVYTTANVVSVGSKTPSIDSTQSVYLEHNNGNTNRAVARERFKNVTASGSSSIGGITVDLDIFDSVMGSTENTNSTDFTAKLQTIERNTYYGRRMPQIGTAVGSIALLRSNKFLLNGQLTNGIAAPSVGQISYIGNTIDASSVTAGNVQNFIFNYGGDVIPSTYNFVANNVYLPASLTSNIGLFEAIISSRSCGLSMYYNVFQGTSTNRMFVGDYNGAIKTLPGLQAISVDTNSIITSDLKLNSNGTYRPLFNSIAKSFVDSSKIGSFSQSFNGYADFYGILRPSSGFIDSGAILFSSGGGGFRRRRR